MQLLPAILNARLNDPRAVERGEAATILAALTPSQAAEWRSLSLPDEILVTRGGRACVVDEAASYGRIIPGDEQAYYLWDGEEDAEQ